MLSCIPTVFRADSAERGGTALHIHHHFQPPIKASESDGVGSRHDGLFLLTTEGSCPHGANRPCHRSIRFGWKTAAQVLRPRVRLRLAEQKWSLIAPPLFQNLLGRECSETFLVV